MKTALIAIVLALPVLVWGQAQSGQSQSYYETGRDGTVTYYNFQDLEAFRQFKDIDAVSVAVPTVVEVPFDEEYVERPEFAVIDKSTNVPEGHYFKRASVSANERMTAAAAGVLGSATYMSDGDLSTYAEFPAPASGDGVAEIVLASGAPVTSTSLTLLLGEYGSLPVSVEVRAMVNGSERVVVATRPMDSSTVRFLETTSDRWRIRFTHVQPLRISDLRLEQEGRGTEMRGLRFLAQPGHSYRVLFNPDAPTRLASRETGNLYSDEGVIRLAPVASRPNAAYRPSDTDGDGMADAMDNCVTTHNPDQADLNGNRLGDACEDFDRDGRPNTTDNCPNDPNAAQTDEDYDGVGDACDREESRITERHGWLPWAGIGIAAAVLLSLFAMTARDAKKKDETGPGTPPESA